MSENGSYHWPASKRTDDITYAVRDILLVAEDAKKAGKEMLYLNIGDPNIFDFDVPEELVDAVCRAMKSNCNGYAPSQGVPEAIDAIRQDAERKGIKNICEIFTSYGASEGIELCLTALADPGDNIILPSPGYPLYSALNSKLNLESRFYELDESKGWQPNVESMASLIDERTKALVLINPNNPTGSLCSDETLLEIIELARRKNIIIFADEIYDRMMYDGLKHTPIASLAHDIPIITFGSLSKCYLAPGWRVGWAVVSGPEIPLKNFVAALGKITRARLCINHPLQYAIKPALLGDHKHIETAMAKLQKRRDITYESLNKIPGISCVKPQGAFYAFARLEEDVADKEFVEKLVRETGVVVVHGSGFGTSERPGHFRVVFLPPEDILEKAFRQIEQFSAAYFQK